MPRTATKLPKPLEKVVQRQALAYLKQMGIAAYRRNVIAVPAEYQGRRRFIRAGEPGQSDIWGVLPNTTGRHFGRHFEAECKRPGERPTLDQVMWLTTMNVITGAAFWFDSIGILATVIDCLRTGGRVQYLDTVRRYGKIEGPSGDYDLVWPD